MDRKCIAGVLAALTFSFAITGYAQEVEPPVPRKYYQILQAPIILQLSDQTYLLDVADEVAYARLKESTSQEGIAVLYEKEEVFSRAGCGGACIGGCLGGIIGIGIVLIFGSPYEEAYVFGPPPWSDEAYNIVLAGMIVGVIAGYILGNS